MLTARGFSFILSFHKLKSRNVNTDDPSQGITEPIKTRPICINKLVSVQFLFQFQSCLLWSQIRGYSATRKTSNKCNRAQSLCVLGSVNPGFYRELTVTSPRETHSPFLRLLGQRGKRELSETRLDPD